MEIVLHYTGMINGIKNKYMYTNKDFSNALKGSFDNKKWPYNQLSYRCEL
jgi:hypothetical protein